MGQMEGDFIFIEDFVAGATVTPRSVTTGRRGGKLCTYHLEEVHTLWNTYSSYCFQYGV